MKILVRRLSVVHGKGKHDFGVMSVRKGADVLTSFAQWMVKSGFAPGMSVSDLKTMYTAQSRGTYAKGFVITDKHENIDHFVLIPTKD